MLEELIGLTAEEKHRIQSEVGPLKTIQEFCLELADAGEKLSFKERLKELLPWATKGGEFVAEILPLAKVLLKIVDEITKITDPEQLGKIACSLAYQRSAALALVQQGKPKSHVPFQTELQSVRSALATLKYEDDLTSFTLEAPVAHPFVWSADESLYCVVRSNGYSESEWRNIQGRIHAQFRSDLVEVLSHGETAQAFEPFTRRLSLNDDSAAYAVLNAQAERQRWLFENRPVLAIEPFALRESLRRHGMRKAKMG